MSTDNGFDRFSGNVNEKFKDFPRANIVGCLRRVKGLIGGGGGARVSKEVYDERRDETKEEEITAVGAQDLFDESPLTWNPDSVEGLVNFDWQPVERNRGGECWKFQGLVNGKLWKGKYSLELGLVDLDLYTAEVGVGDLSMHFSGPIEPENTMGNTCKIKFFDMRDRPNFKGESVWYKTPRGN